MANLYNLDNKLLVGTNGEVRIGDTATVADVKLRVKQTAQQWTAQFVNTDSSVAYGISIDTSASSYGVAGTLQCYTNSGGGFIVRNDSKVGIGVTGPTAKLHIGVSSANDDTFHIFNGSVRTHLLGSESSNGVIYLRSSANSNKVRINTSGDSYFNGGNVGIGTASPNSYSNQTVLTINGSTYGRLDLESGGTLRSSLFSQAANTSLTVDSGFFTIDVGGSERMRIDSSGNVGIGTTNPIGNLNIDGGTGDTTTQDTTFSLTRTSSTTNVLAAKLVLTAPSTYQQNLVFRIKTTASSAEDPSYYSDVMTLDYAGNVGIGTTSPGEPLTVKTKTDAYFPGIKVEDYDSSMGLYIQNLEDYNSGIGTGRYYNSNFWRSDVTAPTAIRLDGGAIRFYAQSGVTADVNYTPTQRMNIAATGAIQFNAYNDANNTGTPTYLLGTDGSGNIVKTNTIPGSGAGPYLPLAGGRITGTAKIEFNNAAQYIHALSNNDLDIVAGDDINYRSNFSRFFSGTTEHCRVSGLANENNWIANGSGGKLGVNITAPIDTLHVDGGVVIQNGNNLQWGALYSNGGPTIYGQTSYLAFTPTGVTGASSRIMLLNGTGLGIGTTSPRVKLHVNGTNASVGTIGTPKNDWYTTAYNGIQIADGTTLWGRAGDSHFSGNYYVSTLGSGGGAQDTYINSLYAHDFWLDNSSGSLKYRNAVSGTAGNSVSFSTRFVVLNNGNFGIGTTTPQRVLDVNVGGNSGVGASFAGAISAGEYQGIHFGYSESGNANYRKSALVFERDDAGLGDATGKIHILNNGQNGANSATLADSRVTILKTGNVGIGTTGPTEKLQVEGKVYIQGNGQDWNETAPGPTRGSVHFDPGTTTADTGNALTFGASDTPGSPNEGSTAQAGIYTRTDGAYGSKMYLSLIHI